MAKFKGSGKVWQAKIKFVDGFYDTEDQGEIDTLHRIGFEEVTIAKVEVKPEEVIEKETKLDEDLKFNELRVKATDLGIKTYRMKKKELVKAINEKLG